MKKLVLALVFLGFATVGYADELRELGLERMYLLEHQKVLQQEFIAGKDRVAEIEKQILAIQAEQEVEEPEAE